MHPADADMNGVDRERALSAVGPGWAALVNAAYDAKPDDVTIVQVKEKFGRLRIYFQPGGHGTARSPEHYAYQDLLNQLETGSGNICEKCGGLGRLREIERHALDKKDNWFVVACRCDEHQRDATP